MSAPEAKKRVLVVEDDASTRDLIVRALSRKYDVVSAADGLEASEKLGTMAPPDLIVCDVMMPKVDGFSFIKQVKSDAALANVAVIFLTAKAQPSAVVQGIQVGAKHFLTKPFSPMDLLSKVEKLLG
jgi:CheY-like chemotaxis protein